MTSQLRHGDARQPQLYGAAPLQYRQGTAVATGESPPQWIPNMEADSLYPYSVVEWERDVRRWCAATKVTAERQGPLLSLAVGSAARIYADQISTPVLQYGALMDLGDGLGNVHRTGVDILLAVIKQSSHQMPKLRC